MLRLKSLGQTLIEADDARLTPAAETVFAVALYLIVEAGRPVGRDELTRMMWPGVSEARAQHGLRQALYRLKTLGATIKADRSSLVLSPRFCTTDFAPLTTPQPAATLEQLAETIEGCFLPEYNPQLSEEFTTWVERQRDVVHSAVARTLVAGMQAKKRVSDWGGAERLASMCLRIDPLNEEATLTVAEAAALGGSKTKALSILSHYLKEIGGEASQIKLPAALLRRRISEAYQDHASSVRETPYVGRDEEMHVLTRALGRARSGHGSACLIWGESGIGKTRLVSQFMRAAALQHVHIVRMACQTHDVKRPLSAFMDLVPKLLALPGALGCSPKSMQYLRRLTAQERDTESGDENQSTEGIFEHIRASVLDLVDAVASESPLIIHIEDSQWLDEHSRSVHDTLCERSRERRLLLVSTFTADLLADVSCDRSGTTLVHLRPLSTEASIKLVDDSLSDRGALSPRFRDWCVRSGCGNPFFIVELVAHAVDDGSFTPPPSLSKLIENRLDALMPLSRRLLQASCILGRHSLLSTIETVLDERRIALLESLDELDARGFIDHEGERVTSRHALITAAALTGASSASRAILHRHAAGALEIAAESNATVMWDCAEHWRQAGDHARAVSLMRECARHALDIGLALDAARMLEAAAELAEGETQLLLLRDCTNAFSTAGAWEDSHRLSLVTLEAATRIPTSADLRSEVELSFLITSTNGDAVTDAIQERLFALITSESVRTDIRLRAALTTLIAADNKQDRKLADRAHDALMQIDPKLDAGCPHRDHSLIVYHNSFGNPRVGLPAVDRLIEFARHTQDFGTRTRYLEHSGHAYRMTGDLQLARALYEEAFRTAREHYLYYRAECCANSLCIMGLNHGNLDDARRWNALSVEQSLLSGRTTSSEEALSCLAELRIRDGRYDEARVLISSLRPYTTRLNAARSTTHQLALEVDVKLASGDKLDARECEVLLSYYPKIAIGFRQDYFMAQLVRGLSSAGRGKEARQLLRQYVDFDRRSQDALFVDLVKVQESMIEHSCETS